MSGNYDRKDKLYQAAKASGYRSRAAYKLKELDKKFKLLKPGARVLDLGCFPGGWLQVAAEKLGPKGLIIGIDLNAVEPVSVKAGMPQPIILQGDICSPDSQQQIRELCGGQIDLVLSDMSPKLSGIRFRDSFLSAELVAMALQISQFFLAPGGSLVTKIFPGQECEEVAKQIRPAFAKFSRENLDSSRKTSTELYFVAQNYNGSEPEIRV